MLPPVTASSRRGEPPGGPGRTRVELATCLEVVWHHHSALPRVPVWGATVARHSPHAAPVLAGVYLHSRDSGHFEHFDPPEALRRRDSRANQSKLIGPPGLAKVAVDSHPLITPSSTQTNQQCEMGAHWAGALVLGRSPDVYTVGSFNYKIDRRVTDVPLRMWAEPVVVQAELTQAGKIGDSSLDVVGGKHEELLTSGHYVERERRVPLEAFPKLRDSPAPRGIVALSHQSRVDDLDCGESKPRNQHPNQIAMLCRSDVGHLTPRHFSLYWPAFLRPERRVLDDKRGSGRLEQDCEDNYQVSMDCDGSRGWDGAIKARGHMFPPVGEVVGMDADHPRLFIDT